MTKPTRITELLLCGLLMVLLSLVLVSCGAKQKTEIETPAQQESGTETATEAPPSIVIEDEPETEPETEAFVPINERVEKDGMISSYLTGELVPIEQGCRRPVAVMMSNDKEAAPQYGMMDAGVIYEAPVEGTMNRFMSVIEAYDDLDRIGSVRSCRTYYTYFAREWDAIYAHYGQSSFAKPYLDNVDNINGVDGSGGAAYYRSKDKKSPHNAYTSGEMLDNTIDRLGYSRDYSTEYEERGGHFRFNLEEDEIVFEEALSLPAGTVKPGYTYNAPWFTYDPEDGLYYRYQYGREHMSDKGQVAVKNIIFQYCPVGHYADTDYLNIDVHEDGYGFIITNGRAMPFASRKDGEFGVTHYYDMEGNEFRINRGKTWICIIDSKGFDKTEILE